jgi:hypothetical protein
MIPSQKTPARIALTGFFLLIFLTTGPLAACSPAVQQPVPSVPPTAPPVAAVPSATETPTVVQQAPVTVQATKEMNYPNAVWFTSTVDKVLVRIDPKTHQLVGRISLPGRIGPVMYVDGDVWAVQTLDKTGTNLLKIDPTSFAVKNTIPIEYGTVTSMLSAAGSLWLGIAEPAGDAQARTPDEFRTAGGIARVDPESNTVSAYQHLDSAPYDLQVSGNTLWSLQQQEITSVFGRTDMQTLQGDTLPAATDSMDSVYRFSHFAITSDSIWAISSDQRSRYFYRLDPTSAKIVSTYEAGPAQDDTPTDLAVDGTAVWLALANGRVLKIDPASGQKIAELATKPGLTRIFFGPGGVWTVSETEGLAFHIDQDAVSLISTVRVGNKPLPTATPAPRELEIQVCNSNYPTRLEAGANATVAEEPPIPNRVRESADKNSKILGELQPGESVILLEGPTCAGGWIWWRVQSNARTDLVGWTSEGDESGYWLVPENNQ